ncbi:MAG: AAA family ATPase [Pirellulaceae bacterium]|nr:AAA family ATPase [Pirellulaceae bacterium]
MTAKANYTTADDVFDSWRDDIRTGKAPVLYPIADAGELAQIEIGPGLVTLFGGAPGAGKTAFTMQAVTDALRLTRGLRAVVCNVEMPVTVLLDRQLARLAGLPAETIRRRTLDASHGSRLDAGLDALESIADRLAFVRPPFTLENIAAAADAFDAGLMLLDYAQRIQPPGQHGDRRASVNALMDHLRQFAGAGLAVLVVAAVGRTKDARGRSSYDADGLNLASFRESSELEFGADDAFILAPDKTDAGLVTLKHLKARHGEQRDVLLRFDKARQAFSPEDSSAETERKPDGKLLSALRGLWGSTAAAVDDDEGGDDGTF